MTATPTRLEMFLTLLLHVLLVSLLVTTPLIRGAVYGWTVAGILWCAWFALGLWAWLVRRGDLGFVVPASVMWAGTAVWGWVMISLFFSPYRPASLAGTALLTSYLALALVSTSLLERSGSVRWVAGSLVAGGLFQACFGLLRRLGMDPFPWWYYADLHLDPAHVYGTFGNYNHLAGYLEMVLLVSWGYALTLRVKAARMGVLLAVFVMAAAHLLSLSRGGWISLGVGGGVMLLQLGIRKSLRLKTALIGLACAGLLLGALVSRPVVQDRIRSLTHPEELADLNGRIRVWRGIFGMIADYPLTGVGPGNFATVFTQYQPPGIAARYFMAHNDYLHFAAEVGLPGLVLILVWGVVVVRTARTRLRLAGGRWWPLRAGALSGMAALAVHSLVDFNLHIPANALLFSVLGAMVIALDGTRPDPTYGRGDN